MTKGMLLIKGTLGNGPVAVGTVRVVDYKDAAQVASVKEGEVLVAYRTVPGTEEAMKKAAAVVTDAGGKTSHAMIQSMIMGLSTVIGTVEATAVLKDGQLVVVDPGEAGIYEYIPPVDAPAPKGKSLADRMAEMAAKSGKSLDPAFLEKLRKKGM